MKVKFIAIAILGKNKRLALPSKSFWVHPQVNEEFLHSVKQQYVVIDDKMIEELGGDIEGAYPLVLSDDPSYSNKNALVFKTLEDVLYYATDAELEQVFIMGGVKTFQDTMPFVSDFHWFEIDVQEGDELTFPDFSNYQWNKVAEKRNKNTNWSFHHLIKAPQKLI